MNPIDPLVRRSAKPKPKSPNGMLNEMHRAMFELWYLFAALPSLITLQRGDGHPVLVMPGMAAGDESTTLLRAYLNWMGYRAEPWKLGLNRGRLETLERHLPERLDAVAQRHGRKVSLIGQSLGGIFARELGRRDPERVRQVITLGSPFAATDSGSSVAFAQQLFKQISSMTPDEMQRFALSIDPLVSPPVPVTAIFSKADGVTDWQVCREAREDESTQNVEILSSHCGMGFNALAFFVIADRLAQAEDAWQRFHHQSFGAIHACRDLDPDLPPVGGLSGARWLS